MKLQILELMTKTDHKTNKKFRISVSIFRYFKPFSLNASLFPQYRINCSYIATASNAFPTVIQVESSSVSVNNLKAQ